METIITPIEEGSAWQVQVNFVDPDAAQLLAIAGQVANIATEAKDEAETAAGVSVENANAAIAAKEATETLKQETQDIAESFDPQLQDLEDRVSLNDAKIGITPEQAAAIIANSAKIGITPEQAAEIIESANKTVVAVSVTGDANKTITLTRDDGTILTASFLDIDTEDPDDVINTLTFNTGNGTLVAITSEGAVISVSLDGRYSLLGHTHAVADITGLQAIITALQTGLASHTHSASQITSGEFVAARLSQESRYYKIDPQVPENGISDVHLVMPSVFQMAIEKSYMGNKTMFQRPVTVEYSTNNGVTWSDASYTDAQLRDLVLGRYSGANISFELSWTTVRFVWDYTHAYWTNGYVFLNYLYLYFNSNGLNEITNIRIEKRDFSTSIWAAHTAETKRIIGEPAHLSVAHPSIRFASIPGRHDQVRIVMSLDNSKSATKILLYNLNWYGAYPANPQSDLYAWNRDKRVAFIGEVEASGYRVSGTSGATGTFTSNNGKTVTVTKGLITSIV